jgi:hypothetical protein
MSILHKPQIIFILGLLVALTGCGSDRGSNPVSPASIPFTAATVSSSMIGPSGGSVGIDGAEIVIPPGALQRYVEIAIERLADNSVELGPSGLTFSCPVHLRLSVPQGGNVNTCVIRWFDPSNSAWVEISSSASTGIRIADLAHFSKYDCIDTDDVN